MMTITKWLLLVAILVGMRDACLLGQLVGEAQKVIELHQQ
jgi:hypothetical protein